MYVLYIVYSNSLSKGNSRIKQQKESEGSYAKTRVYHSTIVAVQTERQYRTCTPVFKSIFCLFSAQADNA